MSFKKILIIGPPSLGYLKKIDETLNSKSGVESSIILIDRYSFKYRNKAHKISNFISKAFFGKNLKHEYVNNTILEHVNKLDLQDVIFIIRPDLLKVKTLELLKVKAKSLMAFYYDSTRRFPKKIEILPLFDKVFSYDKIDVDTYNLQFLTNYIFEESYYNSNYKNLFFNISTYDYRFESMEKLARYIDGKGWSKKIMVLGAHDLVSEHVNIIHGQIPVDEVSEYIKASKIIVEIQREEQIGLSFRAFEALGHKKKFITTNKDVVNYDFYNPQNILVVDINNIKIPEEFVESPYVEVAEDVLNKYRLNTWVNEVFELS